LGSRGSAARDPDVVAGWIDTTSRPFSFVDRSPARGDVPANQGQTEL